MGAPPYYPRKSLILLALDDGAALRSPFWSQLWTPSGPFSPLALSLMTLPRRRSKLIWRSKLI